MNLASIHLYPIKALDPVSVPSARITDGGILGFDRVWALKGADGKFIRGKNCEAVHRVRSRFMLPAGYVSLRWEIETEEYTFRLGTETGLIEGWFGKRFGRPVHLVSDPVHGFPDDTDAYGPTVISEATVETVASWFPGISAEQILRRFRPNLVISGVPPFWEDHLYTDEGSVTFRIGEVHIEGINPCARCVVPTRNPLTGEADAAFMQTFIERRRATLPSWAAASRFDHHYRLSVNTTIGMSEAGKSVRVGDAVAIL
jgi:uncharacterized protein